MQRKLCQKPRLKVESKDQKKPRPPRVLFVIVHSKGNLIYSFIMKRFIFAKKKFIMKGRCLMGFLEIFSELSSSPKQSVFVCRFTIFTNSLLCLNFLKLTDVAIAPESKSRDKFGHFCEQIYSN